MLVAQPGYLVVAPASSHVENLVVDVEWYAWSGFCGMIEACGGLVVSSTAGHFEVRFLCDRSSSWFEVSKAPFDCFDDRTGCLRLFGVVFGRLSCIRLGPLLCGNEHVWRYLLP